MNFVRDIIAEIPRYWDVDTMSREAMVNLICQRARFVGNTLEGRLWPQMTLEFPEDSQGDQS